MRLLLSHLIAFVTVVLLAAEQVQGQSGDFIVDFSLPNSAPADAYKILYVRPPRPSNSTPIGRLCSRLFGADYVQRLRRLVWKCHGKILPLLHLFDKDSTSEAYVNLRVLWNKAISSKL